VACVVLGEWFSKSSTVWLETRGRIVLCLLGCSSSWLVVVGGVPLLLLTCCQCCIYSCPPTGDCPIGSIVLGPDTLNVKHVPVGESVVGSVLASIQTAAATGQYVLMPCVSDSNVSPLWCVAGTDDDREANMVWQKMAVQHLSGVDYVGAGVSLARSLIRTTERDLTRDAQINIPVLVNSKALTSGEELLVFKDKPQREKQPRKPISATDVTKRAKQRMQ
jgi:hypothetical protein